MSEEQPYISSTDEFKNHFKVIERSTTAGKRSKNATQTPIDLYFHRRSIKKRQWEAGNKFFEDATKAALITGSKTFINPDRVANGSPPSMSDAQCFALDRWRKAFHSIEGELGRSLAVNVCVYGYHLNDLKHTNYRNSAEMMPRLREALDDLAKHYHIPYYPDSADGDEPLEPIPAPTQTQRRSKKN